MKEKIKKLILLFKILFGKNYIILYTDNEKMCIVDIQTQIVLLSKEEKQSKKKELLAIIEQL